MNRETFEVIWKIAILVLLLLIAFAIQNTNAADLPEYSDLTFVDQADLDAQVDSVLAVCDTVFKSKYVIIPDTLKVGQVARLDSLKVKEVFYPHSFICRRWAGLTVFEMPDSSRSHSNIIIRDSVDYDWEDPDGTRWRAHLWDQHPGKARLWWWEKEE